MLGQNHYDDTTVLRASFLVVVRRHGCVFPVGNRSHPRQGDALTGQELADGFRTVRAELFVILRLALSIGVALDFQVHIPVLGLQPVCQLLQAAFSFRRKLGAIGRELHAVIGQHHLVQELAFSQFAGRDCTFQSLARGPVDFTNSRLIGADGSLRRGEFALSRGQLLLSALSKTVNSENLLVDVFLGSASAEGGKARKGGADYQDVFDLFHGRPRVSCDAPTTASRKSDSTPT